MPDAAIGDVIEVISTDPGALSDFPTWARAAGNQTVDTKQEAGLIRIYIKRIKQEPVCIAFRWSTSPSSSASSL